MIGVVGESLIDIVDKNELIGGCAFNVAIAASRLGAPVTYFGKVSGDEYGKRILERMIDNDVLFDPRLCGAEEPTLCSRAVLDKEGRASYVFDYKGTAACSFTEDELSAAFSNQGDIDMVFFGSISLLMEPGCDAIYPAIKSMDGNPVKFLDPNVRPSLVKDPEGYRRRILDYASHCDLVRVSDEDLLYLFPETEASLAERSLLKICKGSLIVTRGADGSTWYGKDFRADCPALKIDRIEDTIGCGDTFDGAVMAWLDRNDCVGRLNSLGKQDVLQILRYASAAAGLNCLSKGCEPPDSEQVGRVGNNVVLE